jgi:WD40 repeat protein
MKRCVLAGGTAALFLAACCQAAPLPAGGPRDVATLKGHNNRVTDLAFSPDSKMLVSLSNNDGTVRLWDVATGKSLAKLEIPPGPPGAGNQAPCAVAFLPDGKAFVTSHQGGPLHLWDSATRRCTATLRHPDACFRLAFSADGKCLASASTREMRIWDLATERPRSIFTLKPEMISWPFLLAYLPEGRTLVGLRGEGCKVVTLWDVAAGTKVSTCEGHEQTITDAALSPDGKTLVSSSLDKTLRFWEASTGKPIARLRGEVYSPLAFSPDGKVLACAWNVDGSNTVGAIRLLAFPGLTPLATIKGNVGLIQRLAFSPDGRLLAAGCCDNTIKIWSLPASWPQ